MWLRLTWFSSLLLLLLLLLLLILFLLLHLLLLSKYCFPLHLSSDLLIFQPHSWQVVQLDNFKMHCILTINEKLKKRDQYVFQFDTSCIPYFFWEEEEKHLLIIFCSRDLSVMNLFSFHSKSFKSNFHNKLFKSNFHDKLSKAISTINCSKAICTINCWNQFPRSIVQKRFPQ